MRINKEETIALVVDYQERLMPVMNNRENLLLNTQKLLTGLRLLKIPMFITQQYTKGLGMTVKEVIAAAGQENYFDKISFSCLKDEKISQAIGNSRKNVIVCGIESHICVLQTVIDLQAAGFQAILVEDCISSRKESDHIIAIKRCIQEGALITSYESILYELMVDSKAEQFREISKLIK